MRIFEDYYNKKRKERTVLISDNLFISVELYDYCHTREKYSVRYVIKWEGVTTAEGDDLYIPTHWNENMLDTLNALLDFMSLTEQDTGDGIWQEYPQEHKDALDLGMYNEMEYVQAMLEFALENNRYFIPEQDKTEL